MNPNTPEQNPLVQAIQHPAQPVVQNSASQPQPNPAGGGHRLSAALIDNGIILGLWSIVCLIFALLFSIHIPIKQANNNTLVSIYGLVGAIVSIVYYTYFHAHNGATPGKKLFGLKVFLKNSSVKLTYSKAFLREIIKFGIAIIPIVGGLINLINVLLIIFSKSKQGLHDRVINSQVFQIDKAISLWKQILLFIGLLIFWGISTLILAVFVFSIGGK